MSGPPKISVLLSPWSLLSPGFPRPAGVASHRCPCSHSLPLFSGSPGASHVSPGVLPLSSLREHTPPEGAQREGEALAHHPPKFRPPPNSPEQARSAHCVCSPCASMSSRNCMCAIAKASVRPSQIFVFPIQYVVTPSCGSVSGHPILPGARVTHLGADLDFSLPFTVITDQRTNHVGIIFRRLTKSLSSLPV